MMLLMVLIALAVIVTGPAFDDERARRRARRDFPGARVEFLLPSCGRGEQVIGRNSGNYMSCFPGGKQEADQG